METKNYEVVPSGFKSMQDYVKMHRHPYYDTLTDQLESCVCGFKPAWYSVYYGPTPYDVSCPVCHKQTISYLAFSGWNKDVIKFWNEVVSKHSCPKEIKSIVTNDPYWSSDNFQRRFKTI